MLKLGASGMRLALTQWLRRTLWVCLGVLFAGALVLGWVLGTRRHGPRLVIDGVAVPPGQLRAIVEERAARLLAERVTLTHAGNELLTASWQRLGARVDERDLIERAERLSGVRGWQEWLQRRLSSNPAPVTLPLPVRVSDQALRELLVPLKRRLDVPGQPARYRFEDHGFEPHVPARYADLHRLLDRLAEDARRHASQVEIPDVSIAPKVNTRVLAGFRPDAVLGEFETRFGRAGDDAKRARNIEVGASRIDGLVLLPEEQVSFNDVVGKRTLDNGFQESWQIYKGEMVRGIGGGTCQVSSTLHAAALYAGLTIIERAPHSRPLGYIPLGMDATVAWPTVDLKIANPWPVPVVVHAVVEGNSIAVRVLGQAPVAEVIFHRQTLDVTPFEREVRIEPYLSEGKYIRKQKGIRGYKVRRIRRITTSDGQTREEVSVDRYPPTPELYLVPPDMNVESELPPLPEGAVTSRELG